ncbi:hypothetical protein O7606_26510 [Micromonospora sp. WMMD882]|uniref:hypothetical protein n=1 Tax=Micromonospora sp. WMMD882 TaxID=3015151 RepID=UPI00248AF326|nr:hypothetical protein [Micromonospora sp. WMMD882]WBB79649.1 hypothetical protein O7606_26510 [Micromonospora sp. WMMD882]
MSYDPVTTSSTTTYGEQSHNGAYESYQGAHESHDGVREQARQVGSEAAHAGGEVAQTARDQGREVVGEATRQARNLYGEARTQLHSQAGDQQRRAASGLRSLADEMRSMAQQGGQGGPVTELTHQAAERVQGVAGWLEERQPGDLLNEVRDYARRNPGTFLVGAAVLGVLAGRLTKNIAAGGDGQQTTNGYRPSYQPVADPERTAVIPPGAYATPDPGYADPLAGGYTEPPRPGGYVDPLPPSGTGQSLPPSGTGQSLPPTGTGQSLPPTGTAQPLPPVDQTDPLPGVPSSGVTRP